MFLNLMVHKSVRFDQADQQQIFVCLFEVTRFLHLNSELKNVFRISRYFVLISVRYLLKIRMVTRSLYSYSWYVMMCERIIDGSQTVKMFHGVFIIIVSLLLLVYSHRDSIRVESNESKKIISL